MEPPAVCRGFPLASAHLHESELLILHHLLVDLIHRHRVLLAQLGQPGEFGVVT